MSSCSPDFNSNAACHWQGPGILRLGLGVTLGTSRPGATAVQFTRIIYRDRDCVRARAVRRAQSPTRMTPSVLFSCRSSQPASQPPPPPPHRPTHHFPSEPKTCGKNARFASLGLRDNRGRSRPSNAGHTVVHPSNEAQSSRAIDEAAHY